MGDNAGVLIMELYVQVSFWLGVTAIVINILGLMVLEYPRQETRTLGKQVAAILGGGAFVIWAGIILFT